MTIENLKYNAKKIEHIELSIDAYYRGDILLISLVNNMYILFDSLKDLSDEWKIKVRSYVYCIDVLYGCMSLSNQTELTLAELSRLNGYIANIKSMIDEYKKEHPEGSAIDEEYEEYMRLYPDDNADDDIKQ